MCWDHEECAEGEKCCHAMMDLGLSYCCTEYSGFVFLGLVLGGGLSIALLIAVCYLCMRKAERRLEEEAKLEALKTLSSTAAAIVSGGGRSNESNYTSSQPGPTTPNSSPASSPSYNSNRPPPPYEQIMAPDYLRNHPNHIRRCRSCDPHQITTPSLDSDFRDTSSGNVARSFSENYANGGERSNIRTNHNSTTPSDDLPLDPKYYNLPPLPPLSGSDDKLPTYNECVGHVSPTPCSTNTDHTSSELPSSVNNVSSHGDKLAGGIGKTSSLHRPIYIPFELQQINNNNINNEDSGGLQSPTYRLSTPTQVDDGTGIIVAFQTGILRQIQTQSFASEPENSIPNQTSQAPSSPSSDRGSHDEEREESVSTPVETPREQTCRGKEAEEEAESTSEFPAKDNDTSQDDVDSQDISTGAMSVPDSIDVDEESSADDSSGSSGRTDSCDENVKYEGDGANKDQASGYVTAEEDEDRGADQDPREKTNDEIESDVTSATTM